MRSPCGKEKLWVYLNPDVMKFPSTNEDEVTGFLFLPRGKDRREKHAEEASPKCVISQTCEAANYFKLSPAKLQQGEVSR